MVDDIETRLSRSYGDLGPAPRLKDHVLASLPAQARRGSMLKLPALAALAATVVVFVVLALPPGEPAAPPERPGLLLRAEGDADLVIPVMVARLKDAGLEDVEIRAGGPVGEVEVFIPSALAPSDVLPLLTRRGTLEFRIVADLQEGEEPPEDWRLVPDAKGGEPLLLEEPANPRHRFGGADLDPESIRIEQDPMGAGWIVLFGMREERKAAFGDFTGRHTKRAMAIVIDGRVESAPLIQSRLPGNAQISGGGMGGFSREEAEQLAIVFRSGALPVTVKPVEGR